MINTCVKTLLLILTMLFSISTYASSSSPLNCYWKETYNTDMALAETQHCTNITDRFTDEFEVASRMYIRASQFCVATKKTGYLPKLQGTITVDDDTSCYNDAVYFTPAPPTRIVNGFTQTLLDCQWQALQGAYAQYTCQNTPDNTPVPFIASKVAVGTHCQIFDNPSVNHTLESGVISTNAASNCQVGPVYFQKHPEQQVINGVTVSLQQCQWETVNATFKVRKCKNINDQGLELVVSSIFNNQQYDSLEHANQSIPNGELIMDETLNPHNPPVYFRVNP